MPMRLRHPCIGWGLAGAGAYEVPMKDIHLRGVPMKDIHLR